MYLDDRSKEARAARKALSAVCAEHFQVPRQAAALTVIAVLTGLLLTDKTVRVEGGQYVVYGYASEEGTLLADAVRAVPARLGRDLPLSGALSEVQEAVMRACGARMHLSSWP